MAKRQDMQWNGPLGEKKKNWVVERGTKGMPSVDEIWIFWLMTGQWLFTFHSCEQMCNWSSARKGAEEQSKKGRAGGPLAPASRLFAALFADGALSQSRSRSRDCHMSWHKIPRITLNRSQNARKSAAKMRMMWHFLNATCHVNRQRTNILQKYYCRSKGLRGKHISASICTNMLIIIFAILLVLAQPGQALQEARQHKHCYSSVTYSSPLPQGLAMICNLFSENSPEIKFISFSVI